VRAQQVLIVWASTAFTPTVRKNVDLPDMFEPVTRTPLGGLRWIELGTGVSISGW
jgi:hypothetical protein